MKTTWHVTAYVESEMPLTNKVLPVFSIGIVVVSDTPPSDELVSALVSSHTRNVRLLFAEVEKKEVPAWMLEILKDDDISDDN